MPDQLARLEEMSARIPAAKQHQALGEALSAAVQAANSVAAGIALLENASGFVPFVHAHLTSTEREQLRQWLLSIETMGMRLADASDTGSLAAGTDSLNRDLPRACSLSEGLIRNGWRARIDHAFSSIKQLGGVLRQIPETAYLGLEMASLVHQAEQLRDCREGVDHCVASLAELQTERNGAIRKLSDLGAGEAVVDFLVGVASRSATLTDVTPEVHDWLDARNALERFKVSL